MEIAKIIDVTKEEELKLIEQAKQMKKEDIEEAISLLYEKDNQIALLALLKLYYRSTILSDIYEYWDMFVNLLSSDKSTERTRAIFLLSINTKWDKEEKFEQILEDYLAHVEDEKSITSRQCIKCIANIIPNKPKLKETIVQKLMHINYNHYTPNMKDLIFRDVTELVNEIKK